MSEDLVSSLGKVITHPDKAFPDAVHVALYPAQAVEELDVGEHVTLRKDGRAVKCDQKEALGIVDPFLYHRMTVLPGQWFWLWLKPGTVTGLRHVYSHPTLDGLTAGAGALGGPRHLARASQEGSGVSGVPWRTEDILKMCQEWRGKSHRFSKREMLPILADALEEAGYGDNKEGERELSELRKNRPEPNLVDRTVCLVMGGELGEAALWMDAFADKLDITYNGLMDCADRWITAKKRNNKSKEGDYIVEGVTVQDGSESWRDGFYDHKEEFWAHWETITGQSHDDHSEQIFSCSC